VDTGDMSHFEQFANVRTIQNSVEHFVWHRDKYDRIVRLVSGKDWYIQMEHELPKPINEHKTMFIEKEMWHRVLCTNDDVENNLIISIKDIKY
jgi:hypothetical protein